jgi:hypothetical protein
MKTTYSLYENNLTFFFCYKNNLYSSAYHDRQQQVKLFIQTGPWSCGKSHQMQLMLLP